MTDDQQPTPEYRVEIENDIEMTESEDTQELLQQLVLGQERQNDLLEELLEQLVANQRQRSSEFIKMPTRGGSIEQNPNRVSQ